MTHIFRHDRSTSAPHHGRRLFLIHRHDSTSRCSSLSCSGRYRRRSFWRWRWRWQWRRGPHGSAIAVFVRQRSRAWTVLGFHGAQLRSTREMNGKKRRRSPKKKRGSPEGGACGAPRGVMAFCACGSGNGGLVQRRSRGPGRSALDCTTGVVR
jgi:hypothetical protein